MALITAIILVIGSALVAMIYALGFAVVGFGMATLAVFYYGGAVAGFVWLGVCAFLFFKVSSSPPKE